MVIAVILVFAAPLANACTTFCNRALFGRNYDWNIGYGHITVNKRGMSKTAAVEAANAAKWISRYGSITFNQYGRDNPTGGMNEAGLVVELMWLEETKYPKADSRPELGALEWIQYQLDTASTVAEVLVNARRVRISEKAAPLHFLVADQKGNVAAVEFLNGELIVHRDATALANDPFGKSGFSADRYARAAKGVAAATTVDAAFALLDSVAQPHTQWSIVYDLAGRRITWRTAANKERRTLAFSSFDFGCNTPVRTLDVDAGKGDVAAQFRDYTTEENLKLVRRSIRETAFLRDTADADIAGAAQWPEKSACVISRGR
jgi:YD repeat-containing protein